MKSEFQKPSMEKVMRLYPGKESSARRLEKDRFSRVVFSILAKGDLNYVENAVEVKEYEVKKG